MPLLPLARAKFEEEDSDGDEEAGGEESDGKPSRSPQPPPPAVQPYPIDPKTMRVSHRLILERLYGKAHAEKVINGPSAAESNDPYHQQQPMSPRSKRAQYNKLLTLEDGLVTVGDIALGGGVRPPPLTSRPSTVDNARALSSRPSSRAPLTSRSSTPRVTQVSNLKRLATGQSIARPEGENEWTFLTGDRQKKARETRIREAKIAASRAARGDLLAPPPEWTLEEQELEEKAKFDKALPLYQRQGVALPSSKKSRRPPGSELLS